MLNNQRVRLTVSNWYFVKQTVRNPYLEWWCPSTNTLSFLDVEANQLSESKLDTSELWTSFRKPRLTGWDSWDMLRYYGRNPAPGGFTVTDEFPTGAGFFSIHSMLTLTGHKKSDGIGWVGSFPRREEPSFLSVFSWRFRKFFRKRWWHYWVFWIV